MPRPRFQRVPADKQGAILEAAAKEFAAYGYDEASINRIILAAGFSKGSFYYYFDDKADLAAAVLESLALEYLAVFSELTAPTSVDEFWGALTRFMERGAERMRQAPHTTLDAMMRLATALSRHPELLGRLSTSVMNEITGRAVAFWSRGQELGAVRSDLSVPQLMALMQDVKFALIRVALPSDRAPSMSEVESFARLQMDMVRRVCEPSPEGR